MSDRVKRDYDKRVRNQKRREREGEIVIRYRPGKGKRIPDDDGDYIDYEEVRDE